jgi:hypothetical protein
MNVKNVLIMVLILAATAPLSAGGNKKKPPDRGMLEKMVAVPCGAKERGLSGVGSIWASAGITHINSDEKLCPEYLLRTDEMEYDIRPTDNKHPVILPVGHEGTFKIKKDRMFLSMTDGDDHAIRAYQVVAIKPTNSDNPAQDQSSKLDTNSKSADTP